jgi:hypothetical protein
MSIHRRSVWIAKKLLPNCHTEYQKCVESLRGRGTQCRGPDLGYGRAIVSVFLRFFCGPPAPLRVGTFENRAGEIVIAQKLNRNETNGPEKSGDSAGRNL